ncbi:MAG: response regulator [Anaerolineae bacterium]|nr:response regulator [Anaerolineae bacterium]
MGDLAHKRIFIVEDNIENRIVYQMIFMREGTICEFERLGPQAISRLKNFQPVDLIILDLMLAGGISGYDIFDEIRRHPEFNSIPIVAVSSSDASEAIPKTQRKGFSGYISKPIDQVHFASQINRILRGEAVWDSG